MEDIQTLEEFKRRQHKEVQQRKHNYKMNPVTGWIDSRTFRIWLHKIQA